MDSKLLMEGLRTPPAEVEATLQSIIAAEDALKFTSESPIYCTGQNPCISGLLSLAF